MSRIGKKQIILNQSISVELKDNEIVVKGPKGELNFHFHNDVEVQLKDNVISVLTKKNTMEAKTQQGTVRQIIANMVTGVDKGWSKTLEIIGTGFRGVLDGKKLVFSLGYSHKLEVEPPEGITFSTNENKVVISGMDKGLVGKIAAEIRELRVPDAYKGKGIRYFGEKIKLKPGKAAKTAGGAK